MLYNSSKIFEHADKKKIKFIYGNENANNEQSYINISLEGSKSYEKLNNFSKNKRNNNKVNFNDNIKINIYNSTYEKKNFLVDTIDSSCFLKDDGKKNSTVYQKSEQHLKDGKFDNEKNFLHLDNIHSTIPKDKSVFGLDFSINNESVENRSINLEFLPSRSNFSVNNDTVNSSSTKYNKEKSTKLEPETLDQYQNNKIMTSSKLDSFTSKIKKNEGICNKYASCSLNFPSISSKKVFQVLGTSSNKTEVLEPLKPTENINDSKSSKNVFVEKTEKIDSDITSKRDVFLCKYSKRRSSKIGEEKYGIEIDDVFKKIYNRNRKCVLESPL